MDLARFMCDRRLGAGCESTQGLASELLLTEIESEVRSDHRTCLEVTEPPGLRAIPILLCADGVVHIRMKTTKPVLSVRLGYERTNLQGDPI